MRPNFNDVSKVAKVEISTEKYAQLPDTVLAWKQKSKLGRFDPSAPTAEDRAAQQEAKLQAYEDTITARGIEVGKRCRVGEDDARRGEVAYVGEVEKIPGGGKWIGVKLDEPVGKNDGSLDGHRYWGKDADGGGPGPKYGVFVRPERVEVGDWPVQDDLDDIEF
jgi:tubulin-folding cofactor B